MKKLALTLIAIMICYSAIMMGLGWIVDQFFQQETVPKWLYNFLTGIILIYALIKARLWDIN